VPDHENEEIVEHSPSSREGWCGLLAQADPHRLTMLLDDLLTEARAFGDVRLLRPTQTGTAQLVVREPIVEERFIIGDALVTVAEVSFRGTMGWSMRQGGDQRATISAAIADAILTTGDPILCPPILTFVESVRQSLEAERRRDWEMVKDTAISFEELD
jgi:alpha-D-ribose 1-methylphosphonate 5-triphosphate synthase subunit PhnG